MSIQQMREQRNELAREIRHLLDQNPASSWNKEHQKVYDEKVAKVGELDDAIAREEKAAQLLAEKNAKEAGVRELGGDGLIDPRNLAKVVFNKFLRSGADSISAEEMAQIRATMSTTTGSEGGFTVPTETARSLVEALKAYGGMRRVADVIVTATGAPMNWPTSDGTAEEGELVDQNVSAATGDPSFGTRALSVYKYSSKIITIPLELLQDTTIDMEGFATKRMASRLGRITNRHFTVGTGTNQPFGVVPMADAGKVGATGQTLTVTYDDIIELIHSVDPDYREQGNCRFMMTDGSIKVVRKLKDTAGRPLWLPSYDAGIRGGVPQELAGFPIQTNQHVADMAANAKSILFGDFSYYKIRDALVTSMFRFADSKYLEKGQIGFLAWQRSGGNFVGVTGTANPIKYYQNSAT